MGRYISGGPRIRAELGKALTNPALFVTQRYRSQCRHIGLTNYNPSSHGVRLSSGIQQTKENLLI